MHTRREFLRQVGGGMLAAGLGIDAAQALGLAPSIELDDDQAVPLGRFESLAALFEDLSPDALLPALVARLDAGLPLADLTAAAALANARRCGGVHYDGYHAFMALVPALEMAGALEGRAAALPVLKVALRSARFMRTAPAAARMAALPVPRPRDLLAAVRRCAEDEAEAAFAAHVGDGTAAAWAALQPVVRDDDDVHRAVLAWRAYDVLRLAGRDAASVLLRQTVRHCVDVERSLRAGRRPESSIRTHLPALLADTGLGAAPLGREERGADWVDGLARDVYAASKDDGASLVAGALASGASPRSVGRALSLAATRLVLRDPGRARGEPGKPAGSVHGAGNGVHACDSIQAWRGIAATGDARHTAASLVASAYYVAGRGARTRPAPLDELAAARPETAAPDALAAGLRSAIDAQDQVLAMARARDLLAAAPDGAAAHRVLLEAACRQDGALHAEKYLRTQQEAFDDALPEHRAEHLLALARVVASQACAIADGVPEAERLLAR